MAFTAIFVAALLLQPAAAQDAPDIPGASPGERAAIGALCGSVHGSIARQMCVSNQMVGLLRTARAPDLSVAPGDKRAKIEAACNPKEIPADIFACERAQLSEAGLPVRDEPGGGVLSAANVTAGQTSPLSPISPSGLPGGERITAFPAFSLESWRQTRPQMPAVRSGDLLPAALYERIWPSIYVVIASDQPVELVERTSHAQGSAVAISDRLLLTNCHVVAGRPQIMINQQGKSGHATLAYADPAGDRCFLKSEDFAVRPVPGVRRFADLHVGEAVFSLGTPQGLELSFNQGLISALRQNEGVHIIQNSAPSWHGSSGGGLFDARGNLVGITTAGATNVPNTYFSIAADDFWP